MKKLIFTLSLLIVGSIFANNLDSLKKTDVSDEEFSTMCCRRSTTDGQGNVWTARRCVTNSDSHQAMGAACALAQADANQAKKNAKKVAEITEEG